MRPSCPATTLHTASSRALLRTSGRTSVLRPCNSSGQRHINTADAERLRVNEHRVAQAMT